MTAAAETHPARQRLDKWLWHARIVRTRSAAAELAASGYVRVNGVRAKGPSHPVGPGDVLTIALDRGVRVLKIVATAKRRRDASHAQLLYVAV